MRTTTHRADKVAEGACFYCETGTDRAATLSLCGEHSVMVLARIRARLGPIADGELLRFAIDQ
ncbi:MAG: hypothetical protein HYU41_18770 [Candidatus Rokubacteria bacterium]|nr:hypothetical protein [Candidatus Rokubacteria bacterium]